MPTRSFCFFCGDSKRSNLNIPQRFNDPLIPLNELVKLCEMMFDIKTSQLSDIHSPGNFDILIATGFNTIYGITMANTGDDDEKTRVIYLDKLNELLLAETVEDKKALFLSHAKNFIQRFLHKKGLDQEKLAAYQPVIDFVVQQFHLAAHSRLYDEANQKLSRQQQITRRISNLKKLAQYISNPLLLSAMDISNLITAKGDAVTVGELKTLLTRTDKFIIPEGCNAKALGYDARLTSDDAIDQTLTNLTHNPVFSI